MSNVLITGGSGMIGKRLSELLNDAGHRVRHLSRRPHSNQRWETFYWNPDENELDSNALQETDAIIHLAGAGIADEKWTEERKNLILDSRTNGARLLLEAYQTHKIKLPHFISASAIGWYPLVIDNKEYSELDPPGQGFLAEVCQSWEASADLFKSIGSKVSKLRIGLVLAQQGGALAQMARPIRFYVGAGLGSGKQKVAWVHLDDVCLAFKHVMEKKLDGVFNIVAPDSINNQDFMQTLADVIDRPIFLPNIPDFVIRSVFGPSSELVLTGVDISTKKLRDSGYQFKYPTLSSALFSIYRKSSVGSTNKL